MFEYMELANLQRKMKRYYLAYHSFTFFLLSKNSFFLFLTEKESNPDRKTGESLITSAFSRKSKAGKLVFSFSLMKKKQKIKTGRLLRSSQHFLENLCRRTKAPAKIF